MIDESCSDSQGQGDFHRDVFLNEAKEIHSFSQKIFHFYLFLISILQEAHDNRTKSVLAVGPCAREGFQKVIQVLRNSNLIVNVISLWQMKWNGNARHNSLVHVQIIFRIMRSWRLLATTTETPISKGTCNILFTITVTGSGQPVLIPNVLACPLALTWAPFKFLYEGALLYVNTLSTSRSTLL